MNRIIHIFKKLLQLGIFFLALILIQLFGSFYGIKWFSSPYVYDTVQEIPKHKVGVVLGTSKYVVGGGNNLYFKYRIEAAVELYKAGKIEAILVSGDNSSKHYNEAQDMKDSLIEKGVPANKIHMDYAGLRTLDTVIRAKEIFGQQAYILISQEFHIERGIFIGRKRAIDLIGYKAKSVSQYYSIKTKFRELFARVKAILDIYILNKQPKYLGKKIKI